MNIFELFAGQRGDLISSVMIIVLSIIMWVVFSKMPKRKKSKVHLNILIALLMTVIYHVTIIIVFGDTIRSNVHINPIIGDLLFFYLYFGLYLISNATTLVKQLLFYLLSAGIVIGVLVFNNTLLSITTTIVSTIGAWYFLSGVGNFKTRTNWVLGALGTSKILLLMDTFNYVETDLFSIGSTALLIVSYTIMLTLIVEHLMNIMQGTYESSISDALTGLYNRRYFTKCINQCVKKDLIASTIFIDLDNFKRLNDSQGHAKGDEVLRKVATIMLEETEGIGIVGRYGGEEIVALIVEPSIDMDELTETIRSRVKKEASFLTKEGEYFVTTSIGYSTYSLGWSADDFIKMSDKALYVAKGTGKDKVIQYGSEEYHAYEEQEINKQDLVEEKK